MREQTPGLNIENSFDNIVQQNPDIFFKPFGADLMIDIEYDQTEATASGAGVTYTYTKTLVDDEGGSGDD